MTAATAAPQLEHLPTASLTPYAANSRTHSPAQIAQIAASIKEFGFTNPVLIDAQGGIIAGHGRVMAAVQLGLQTVPCLRLSHLSDTQKRAYIIADNKLAENADWDEAVLAAELQDLQGTDFDLDLLGFDTESLTALLGSEWQADGQSEGQTDPDDVPPEPVVPVSRLGDVWLLGRHRLMCGDSTDAASVGLLMAGEKAQLLHADPPYGMGKENKGVENDNLYADKLDAFQMNWWRIFRTALENNANAYVWGNAPDLWRLWYVGGLSASERLTVRNQIIWDKKSGQGMNSDAHRMFPTVTEHCLFFMLGEQGFNNNANNYWNGWDSVVNYLNEEKSKTGWNFAKFKRLAGHSETSGCHWFDKSQWSFPTKEVYDAWKAEAAGKAFKRDYDALKRDFYATRAYFDNTHDKMTDVWEFPRVTGDERHGHATPKPVAMMERCIKSSLPDGGLCVEPFSGSGTTIIAAEKTARRCYAMELSPQYVDVAVTRWQNFTGQQAILEATGEPFPAATKPIAASASAICATA